MPYKVRTQQHENQPEKTLQNLRCLALFYIVYSYSAINCTVDFFVICSIVSIIHAYVHSCAQYPVQHKLVEPSASTDA